MARKPAPTERAFLRLLSRNVPSAQNLAIAAKFFLTATKFDNFAVDFRVQGVENRVRF